MRRQLANAVVAIVAIAAVVLLWAVVEASLLNRDVAALISLSGRLLDGLPLNDPLAPREPPFALLVYAAPLLLARALPGLDIPGATVVFVTIAGVLSLALSWRDLKVLAGDRWLTAVLLILFAIVAIPVLLAWHVIAQREHLAFIFMLPWLLFRVADMAGAAPQRGAFNLIAAAVLAAVGFCIKPVLAVIFIAVEGLGVVIQRRLFAWVRLDSLIIGGFGLAYLLAWRLLYPAYFADLGQYVETIAAADLTGQMLGHALLMVFAIIMTSVVAIAQPAKLGRLPSLVAIGLAILCAALFWLQGRPFPQQIYLVYAFLGLACALAASGGRFLFPIALTFGTIWLFQNHEVQAVASPTARVKALRQAADLVRPYVAGKRVTVIAVNLYPAWPLMTEAGARFDGPIRNLYYLTNLSAAGDRPNEVYMRDLMARYVAERRPPLILVLDRVEGKLRIDPLQDLQRSDRFAVAFTCYKLVTTAPEISTGRFQFHPELYRRRPNCNA